METKIEIQSKKANQKPKDKNNNNIKSEKINQKEKNFKDLIEKSNPEFSEYYSKRTKITNGESEDFNKFCNQNLKLKMNVYGNVLTVIYLALSVVTFMKFKSDFYGISFLTLTVLNILVFIFEHKIKKCKTINSFLFKFCYYFIFLCSLIVLYEFLYFLFGEIKFENFKETLKNMILCDFIDFGFCILTYSMIFVFSINSYFVLIIVNIVNILVIIFLKNHNNFPSGDLINFNYFENNTNYVNKTLIEINNKNNNSKNDSIMMNSTNIYNKEISLSSNLIIDNNYFLYKKIICFGINFSLFILFCFINKSVNISLIIKFKYEQLMSFAITMEKNLCSNFNTKKVIFKNNQIIENDYAIDLIHEADKAAEKLKIETYNENDKNRLTKLKNFFFRKKTEYSNKENKNSIDDSANNKLNINFNNDNNQVEILFKNFNENVANNINKCNNNNEKEKQISVKSIHNEEIIVKLKEKKLSESIDDILNNPNSFLINQMESLSFLKNYKKLKEEENIFGSQFNFLNNANTNNIENRNIFENKRCDSNLNYNNNNNKDNIVNNENLSLRVMANSPVNQINQTENLKNNSNSKLFYDIINLILNSIFIKDQKALNKNINLTNANKNAYKSSNKNSQKYIKFTNKTKQNLGFSKNTYCYLGTYIKKADSNVNPIENEADKSLKILNVFYEETQNKKINFIQFYFQEMNFDAENLKNFCNKHFNFVQSDETNIFNPISNNWKNPHNKNNMILKSGEDFAYYSLNHSNNLIKDSNKIEFLFKQKLEKTKLKKTLIKKNLFLMKNMFNDFKIEFENFALRTEDGKMKNIQSLISLQEDNLIKFNRLQLIISKKALLDHNYFNLGKLVEFTNTYIDYIYRRVLKSSSNSNASQAYLLNNNINSNNIVNSNTSENYNNNNYFNFKNIEIQKNNTNNFIFSNIACDQFKEECFKDLFVGVDLEVYKQILFSLVIELNYILKEYENENENSITQEILINNENEIKFDKENYSTRRFSRLFEHLKINKCENETENNSNNNNNNTIINENGKRVKNYLKFDSNGNFNSDENLIFIEISISTCAKAVENLVIKKSSNKNLKINNSYFIENGSRTIGSGSINNNNNNINNVNNNNLLSVKRRINRTNSSMVHLPRKFIDEGMITEIKRKFSIPRQYKISVVDGEISFKPGLMQNMLNSKKDSLILKASKEIPKEENGNLGITRNLASPINKKSESNNSLNINNNNCDNALETIDCEILKNKIDKKFYDKLASLLNCTLSLAYDEQNNSIKFTLKPKKFFKKSDINDLDITLNSEKLKDFSPKTLKGGQSYYCLTSNNIPNYGNYTSENMMTLNLNSVKCYNINEEEEIFEEEKENEIKMKYKIGIDDESFNNPVLNFNGIDTYVEENSNNFDSNNRNKNSNNKEYINNKSKNNISFRLEDDSDSFKENFSNIEEAREINEFNNEEENAERLSKALFEKEKKISLIPNVGKILERQLHFKRLVPIKKFTEISSQSQLDHIINLIEDKSNNNFNNNHKE